MDNILYVIIYCMTSLPFRFLLSADFCTMQSSAYNYYLRQFFYLVNFRSILKRRTIYRYIVSIAYYFNPLHSLNHTNISCTPRCASCFEWVKTLVKVWRHCACVCLKINISAHPEWEWETVYIEVWELVYLHL